MAIATCSIHIMAIATFSILIMVITTTIIMVITTTIIMFIATVSCHNFKSQNFKLSVSNPKSKYLAYLPVLSQISNCQSLGHKNKHDILKTDRTIIMVIATTVRNPRFASFLDIIPLFWYCTPSSPLFWLLYPCGYYYYHYYGYCYYPQFAIQDFASFRTQPLENLSAAVKLPIKNRFLGNPTLGESLGT